MSFLSRGLRCRFEFVAGRCRRLQVAQSELNSVEHMAQQSFVPEDLLVVPETRVEDASLAIAAHPAYRQIFVLAPLWENPALAFEEGGIAVG